ncbi:DUF1833 family protein [Bradyrhizobium sp. WSM4349]|uniref:DUF1833 family protein n=1 Tax=Bradyrhizobium sp. WSM4349 TaxID=1040988 RepID=UPI000379E9F2|nr:DUF1833 family protein [Bradyrhizobium sp. WSM4349]
MPRSLSQGYRNELEASRSAEVTLVFATITHPDIVDPIRVVSDVVDYMRVLNDLAGAPVSVRYIGIPFDIELLTDGDAPPRGKITIQNVDQAVGAAIEDMSDSPRLMLEILALSDFGDIEIIDDRRTRQPLGTPTIEYSAAHLSLKNITGNAISVSADITVYDVQREPWPGIRTTQNRLPGLYR